MRVSVTLTAISLAAASSFIAAAQAATYNQTTGTTEWTLGSNWDTAPAYPNAVGAIADFPSATGTRSVTIATDVTVGAMSFTNNASFATTIGNTDATGGQLILDNGGSGVTITESGASTNIDALAATMVFNDDVIVDVENTGGNSAGAFRLGGPITGSGGLTKNGPGLMTIAFTPSQIDLFKDYTGPTVFNGGRVRLSSGGAPRFTSSVTINDGATIDLIQNNIYTFGSQLGTLPTLYLNGTGAHTGPYAAFPGAIRNDTDRVNEITNPIGLQSDAQVNVYGANASLTWSGSISGSGKLVMGGGDGSGNLHGILMLTAGNNTNSGGISVIQGTVELTATSAADAAPGLGTGDVYVDGLSFDGNTGIYGWGHLVIDTGVDNAIKNSASLSIDNGNGLGGGNVTLGAGINETIGSLYFNSVRQVSGVTYGSSDSTAMFTNDTYFVANAGQNTGILTVGILGDFSGDGSVDAADYVVWRKSYSGNSAMYDLWRASFGSSSPGSGSGGLGLSAVPEPSTIVFALVLSCILGDGTRFQLSRRLVR